MVLIHPPNSTSQTSETVTSSAIKMKILKTMEYHLKMLGCIPFELPLWGQKMPVNKIHIGLIFALLIQNLCSTILFWIYEAETYKQRTQSGFFCTRSFLSLVLYARLVWKKNQLADLVRRLEDIVAKSKTKFR